MLRRWRPRNVRWFSFLAGLCVPVLAAFVTVELIRPGVFLSREVALATVTRVEWWQNPGLLRGAMLALGLGAYLLAFALTPRAVLASLISLAPAVVVGVMAQGRRAEQEYQSCANCRSFTKHKLEDYARAHQGWFPREGRDEWECLAKLIDDADDVHYFTSHAQTRAAETQWSARGSGYASRVPYPGRRLQASMANGIWHMAYGI